MMNVQRALLPVSFAASLFLLTTGCVSQRSYLDLQEEKRQVQSRLDNHLEFVGTLEAKIARLQGELDIYRAESVPIDAGVNAEIDERLERLDRAARGIASGGDVTLLSIDGGFGLSLDNAVLFDSGSATIREEGEKLLEEMSAGITSDYHRVIVRGHSDSDPITREETLQAFPGGNLQLSTARAVTVAGLLIKYGIQNDRIVVEGFGAAEPVAPNDTPENKRKNRRVEILVLEKDS